MKQLDFSHNWNNKLMCTSYTSLRFSPRFDVGDAVEVTLNGKPHHLATVVGKRALPVNDINDFIARLDTGYNRKGCLDVLKTMYKNQVIDDNDTIYLYLFERESEQSRVERLMGRQAAMFE